MKKPIESLGLQEFQVRFDTEEACEAHLFKLRWPNGYQCPNCGTGEHYYISARSLYQCTSCRHQTSITAGTMMNKSKLSLRTWFWAIYLCVTDKRGYSALALSTQLGISYPTAWLLLHKIRMAMAQRDANYQLLGSVEVDDAYVGGVSHRTPGTADTSGGGSKKDRIIIALSVDKEGKPNYVKMRHVEQVTQKTANAFITDACAGGSRIISDGSVAYNKFDELGFTHKPKIYYKSGPEFLKWVHTIISNFNSFVNGTYHGLGNLHLQKYLDEFCYRFNRRWYKGQLFDRLALAIMSTTHFRWVDLIAESGSVRLAKAVTS